LTLSTTKPENPSVILVIKRQRGGSQSSLVMCDDGKLYVLKMHPNPQGPNVLANEALGAILLRRLGFLVPDWKPITINPRTVHLFPELVMASADGNMLPACGVHFGSEQVGYPQFLVSDILPESYRCKVKNADQFAAISIFDLWANHHDERQCVYRMGRSGAPYEAFFIDNGHLFGGPNWSEETDRSERLFSVHIGQPSFGDDPSIERWISCFEGHIPQILQDAVGKIPREWYQGDIVRLYACMLKRLRNLRRILGSCNAARVPRPPPRNAEMAMKRKC
jgi:hypothetical protein